MLHQQIHFSKGKQSHRVIVKLLHISEAQTICKNTLLILLNKRFSEADHQNNEERILWYVQHTGLHGVHLYL